MRFVLLLFLALSPALCSAGAWPREKGTVFLSFTTTTQSSPQLHATQIPELAHSSESSLYIEYGLNDRITLGFDGRMTDTVSFGEAFVFARVGLGNPSARNRYAASFAVGKFIDTVIEDFGLAAEHTTLTRFGLHYGRGLNHGWLGADAYATERGGGTELKLDATWGLKPWENWMFIAQIQTGQPPLGDSYANFAPSIVWKMNKRISLEVGFEQPLGDDRDPALKLGTWTEF